MADGKAIGAVLETQEWLEPTGKALQGAIKTAFDAAGQAKKPIENALNGVWLGHTLHPALVHEFEEILEGRGLEPLPDVQEYRK